MNIRKIKNSLHKRRMIIWAMLVIVQKVNGLTGANQWMVNGYIKHFSVVFDVPVTGSIFGLPDRWLGLSSDRLRMDVRWRPANLFDFNLAYDTVLRIQDPSLFTSGADVGFHTPGGYRFADVSEYLMKPKSGESVGLLQNLDRIVASIHLGQTDVFIGRQAIAWGSGRVINPTDVIAPFTFESLDTEDRQGVDAVRVRIPVGWMGEVDAGFLFGTAGAWKNAAYIRARQSLWQTDIAMMIMQFQGNALVGWDFARSIGGAGTWLEAAWVLPDAFRKQSVDWNVYWRFTAGSDYNFSNGLYGFLEYHFNGPGESRPDNYLKNTAQIAYRSGRVYLLAKHYAMIGGQYQISSLWTLQCQFLLNLNDRSFMIAPQISVSVAQNVDLSGGLFLGAGQAPSEASLLSSPRSEFGLYPDFAYCSVQFYY
jgi:hypothetical protein